MSRFVACCLTLTFTLTLGAADWSQFRGPAGSGVADDQKPPVKFGPKENLAWKVAVPPGASSPIVVGDKIVLTAFEDGKLFTICYSRTDGKELWRADAKAKKIEEFHPTEGSPAASTPASDGKIIVSYFGSCGLICYDLDGKELWRFDLPTAETDGSFGSGVSPVIEDGLVLLARDLAKNSAVYAVDLATGSQKWKTDRPAAHTNYATPVVWNDAGRKVLAVAGSKVLEGYDAKTGDKVWTVDKLPSGACATPVLFKDTLVYAAWSPGGADFKMPSFDEILKQAEEEKLGYVTQAGSEKTFIKGFFKNQDTNKDGKLTREEWDENMKMMLGGENRAVALKPGGEARTRVVLHQEPTLRVQPAGIPRPVLHPQGWAADDMSRRQDRQADLRGRAVEGRGQVLRLAGRREWAHLPLRARWNSRGPRGRRRRPGCGLLGEARRRCAGHPGHRSQHALSCGATSSCMRSQRRSESE